MTSLSPEVEAAEPPRRTYTYSAKVKLGLAEILPLEEIVKIRLSCVDIAARWAEQQPQATPPLVMAYARDLADFVLGTNDAEVLRAARDLAEKIKD